jgi:hypothetical protein
LIAGNLASSAQAHIEAQYTLGRVASEATNILIIEVTRVNKEKNLVICKKVRDLKGKHDGEIKQNIGQRGEPSDSKAVMDWAQVGRQAVFFYNDSGSLTCTGTHWYQCFLEGEWWAMSHAEVYMVRTYFGDAGKLCTSLEQMLAGKEVIIPCLVDGPREALQAKSGKVQTMKASLKLVDYNPKRDLVSVVGGAASVAASGGREKATVLPAGSNGWKFIAVKSLAVTDYDTWRSVEYDDKQWAAAKTPFGYGEAEIGNRKGTTIKEQGQGLLLRRSVEIPSDLLARKDVKFQLRAASDDSAKITVNGKVVADDQGDHEFAYWNQTISLPADVFRAGNNVIAVNVHNTETSSDLYFDVELSAEFNKDAKK